MEIEILKNHLEICNTAFKTLDEALNKEVLSQLEQDWTIQRFEYTIELFWKMWKRYLEFQEVHSDFSPRWVMKELYKYNIISDLEIFLKFLHIRNSLSHIYSEQVSHENFEYIKQNYKNIQETLNILDQKVSS